MKTNEDNVMSYEEWVAEVVKLVVYKEKMEYSLRGHYDQGLSPYQSAAKLNDCDWMLLLPGIEDFVTDVQNDLAGFWSDEIERNVYSWYPEGITVMDAVNRVKRQYPQKKKYWVAQLGYTNDLFKGEYFYLSSALSYATSAEFAVHIPEPERIVAMTAIKEEDYKFLTQDDLPF